MSDIVKGYTPGLWIAADYGDYGDYDGNCIVILGNNEQVRVAVVLGVNDAETKATARLIASAPDMADTITRLTSDNENLAKALETAGRLFAASRDALAEVNAENEKLRALLYRVHRHPSEPECQLADDGKCPGSCVCGYFEWFEKDHALTNEILAALTGDKQ